MLLLLFVLTALLLLLTGFPVAFTLAGSGLLFALLGIAVNELDPGLLLTLPNRIFGIVSNVTLTAVPMFVLMGTVLERSGVAADLLNSITQLGRGRRGGMAVAVVLVGALLAASTGIVGATVVMLGLIAVPPMLKAGYDARIASGTVAATGTLGQIIPPSIALVLLSDVIASAYQQAQLQAGNFNPDPVSVGHLFAGAFLPGLVLVLLYLAYLMLMAVVKPHLMPSMTVELAADSSHARTRSAWLVVAQLLPPLSLVIVVLGAMLAGIATPTEAAGLGAFGAILIAIVKGKLTWDLMRQASHSTVLITAMVFMILIGASIFTLVFRELGGDEVVAGFLGQTDSTWVALAIVMLLVFVLGFVLDFIEIIYIIIPVFGPVLFAMGIDPVWFAVLIAINLQTSFLTPPFGFALFYLRGVLDSQVATPQIYAGVLPFIGLQLLLIALVWMLPSLATFLPDYIYGNR